MAAPKCDHHLFPESTPETIVGGGPVSIDVLSNALTFAPRLVAADGGADCVLAAGLRPARVVGDMDSVSDAARAAFADVLQPISEQDSTDFAKALRTSAAPWSIGVGFIGARVDHFLSCLSVLARRRADPPCVLISDEDCICILPADAQITLPVGSRLSLWPLGLARGRSTGLEWPVDGLEFAPDGRVGTSNRTALCDVSLSFEGAAVALLIDADALPAMLKMLQIDPRRAGEGVV